MKQNAFAGAHINICVLWRLMKSITETLIEFIDRQTWKYEVTCNK